MALVRKLRPRSTSQEIAGVFCIVERGRIVRAAAADGVTFWAAGRGSWTRIPPNRETRAWPTLYAGEGSPA